MAEQLIPLLGLDIVSKGLVEERVFKLFRTKARTVSFLNNLLSCGDDIYALNKTNMVGGLSGYLVVLNTCPNFAALVERIKGWAGGYLQGAKNEIVLLNLVKKKVDEKNKQGKATEAEEDIEAPELKREYEAMIFENEERNTKGRNNGSIS